MDEALTHFSQISGFGRSASLFVLILAADLAITAIHSWQEWKGKGAPQWRYLGAIAGVKVPDGLGFLFFTAGLTLLLWACGVIGIAGWFPFSETARSAAVAFCLGFLIGGRLSDTWVSHLKPHYRGYRPNPGLSSTPLYVLEAVFLIVAFSAGLLAGPGWALGGIIAGAGLFVVVLPLLRLLRAKIPAWRREPWQPGQPIPAWATEP
jgi:phosphatidylglycerophosphate synthase